MNRRTFLERSGWMALAAATTPRFATSAAALSSTSALDAGLTDYLSRHVKWTADGTTSIVDYAAVRRDRDQLQRLLNAFSRIHPSDFSRWPLPARQAFLVNAYNIWTLALIADAPEDTHSIKELGNFLQSPWKKAFIPFLGETRSLDDIEHGLLRGAPDFNEPRIHFAVNCASIGCPALRPEAYTADRWNAQLDDQTRRFLRDRSRNRVFRANPLHLEVSSIFVWYEEDFERSGGLQAFLSRYADALGLDAQGVAALREGRAEIDYLDYDWRLNGPPNPDTHGIIDVTKPKPNAIASAILIALSAMAHSALAADDPSTLDRVEVTAQRRTQDIGDVPLAVTAIDARTLDDLGASGRDVLALGNRAPSLQAESSFGRTFPRFYVRGLGNNDFDLNASQPVSLVVDGIVMENPTLKGFPVFDLERVEVLRGPQGSLFGRNTPGGVVQFISARPSADEEANFRLGYGTYDTINAEVVAGGGSERSAWRVSALHQERGSVSTNRALPNDRREGFEDQALRAQWLTRIGDNTEALLQLRYRDLAGGSAVYRANVFVPGTNDVVPGFDREALDQDAVPTLDVETRGLSLHLDGRWGTLRWASITSWDSVEMFARGDVDGGFGAAFAPPFGPGPIPFPAESGDGIPDHRQWTQEFRLHSDGDGPTQWLVGAFFFDESLDVENISYDTLAGSALNGFARQTQGNRSEALFGSVSHRVAPAWELTVGGRYTRDRKDFVAERIITPFGGPALGPIRVDPEDNNLSGDVALTWHAAENVQVYGRIASGYRAPAIQGRVLFGDTVSVADSEEILSSELGLKAELLDRRARLAVAAYRYTLDDAQLTAVGGGANFNTLLNADRVIGKGLEVELLARLTPALQVAVGGSWNDSEIDDPTLAVAPCGAGCTVFDPPGALPGTVSIDGNPLVQTPKRIAFARIDWRQDIGSGEVFASADVAHRSEVNFFLYESAEFTGKPLTEVGARLGYRWDGGKHTVSLYGRNLGDQIRAIGGVDFNNLTGFFNEPRVIGIEWQGRF